MKAKLGKYKRHGIKNGYGILCGWLGGELRPAWDADGMFVTLTHIPSGKLIGSERVDDLRDAVALMRHINKSCQYIGTTDHLEMDMERASREFNNALNDYRGKGDKGTN